MGNDSYRMIMQGRESHMLSSRKVLSFMLVGLLVFGFTFAAPMASLATDPMNPEESSAFDSGQNLAQEPMVPGSEPDRVTGQGAGPADATGQEIGDTGTGMWTWVLVALAVVIAIILIVALGSRKREPSDRI